MYEGKLRHLKIFQNKNFGISLIDHVTLGSGKFKELYVIIFEDLLGKLNS